VKVRREAIEREIDAIAAEEAGARDALAEAFETQKKFEQVAESARVAEEREAARRENAAMDEMGLRARGR
jgi:flagellar FliJ protein